MDLIIVNLLASKMPKTNQIKQKGLSYSEIEVDGQYLLDGDKVCITDKHLAIIHNHTTRDSSGREEYIIYYYLDDRFRVLNTSRFAGVTVTH